MQRPTSYPTGAATAAPQAGSASSGGVPQDFAELIAAKMDFSRHFSEDLKRVLYAAYREVQGRRDPCVGRHNLLLALLAEPRIRAHVVLAERDIDKLSSLIHDQLQVINPKDHRRDRPGDTLATGSAPNGDRPVAGNGERWDDELIRLLGYANRLFAYHGLPNIDVSLVFDLLRYDTDLRGLFSFAASGNADHHDARIDQIHDLYAETQKGTDLLTSKLQTLESKIETLNAGVHRLTGETDRQKGDIAEVAGRNTSNTKQYGDLAQKFVALDNKVTGLSLQMSKLEGTLQTVLQLLERATRIGSPYGYGAPDPRFPSADPRYSGPGPGAYPADPRTTAPLGTYPSTGYPSAPPVGGQTGAMPFHGSQSQSPEPYPQDPRLRTEPYQPTVRTSPMPPPDVPAPEPSGSEAKRSFWGGLFAGKAKDEPRTMAPQQAAASPVAAASVPAEPQRYPLAPPPAAPHAPLQPQPVAITPSAYPSPPAQPAPVPAAPTSPAAAAATPRQMASQQPAPVATLPRATAETPPAAKPNGVHPQVKAPVAAPASALASSAATAVAPRPAAVPTPANDPGNRS